MFKIHTKDGKTVSIDFENERQAAEWAKRLRDPAFQKTITGISIVKTCGGKFRCDRCRKATQLDCSHCGHPTKESSCSTGVQFSLSRPVGFDRCFYVIEKIDPNVNAKMRGGQKITCFVDDIRIVVMAHAGQPASRVSLTKIGKQRYNPFTD